MANSKFSSFVFNVIDLAGINEHIRIKRIKSMKHLEYCLSEYMKHNCITYSDAILTGSTAEGTLPMSSANDLDTMALLNGIICVDETRTDISRHFDVLEAAHDNMPPGYVKVRHATRCCTPNIVITMVLSLKSHWYGTIGVNPFISNEIFKKDYFELLLATGDMNSFSYKSVQINGPALTLQVALKDCNDLNNTPLRDFDLVFSILYYNKIIQKEWFQRRRRYDWPSKELLDEVSTMEGYITPVGEKQSENEHLEWRISHVTAEKLLVQSFNSTQYKLYVVLKLFSKQIFTSVCKSFSSYMVKNVVLWMAEINPSYQFTPSLFIAQLLQSLNFIKHCLMCNHLPSYMMPKKNLITRRIFGHEKRALIILLSSLTNEGACVIYRLPRLAACLNCASLNPRLFPKFGLWRHCVETDLLSFSCALNSSFFDGETDFVNIYYINSCHEKISKDERLKRKQLMLMKLIIPDYLAGFPFVSPNEITNLFVKRIRFVFECCFLK